MPTNTQAAEILADKVVDAAVASAAIPEMSKASQKDVKEVLVKETEAIVMNQMNQEPWYMSRIIVLQIVGAIFSLLSIGGIAVAPEYKELIVIAWLAIAAAIQPLATLYARLFAKKPMTLFTGTGK